MRRRLFLGTCLSSVFIGTAVVLKPAVAKDGQKKLPKDGKRSVGWIWSYTAKQGDKTESGQFRVYDKEVFKGAKKVGYIEPKDNDETTLFITDYEVLNGKTVLRKVKRKPPVWKGKLEKKDGSEWHLEVELKER